MLFRGAKGETRRSAAARSEARRRLGLTTPEWLVLAAFALYSSLPLLAVLVRGGGVFTGADGPYVTDQLQYLAWVREAGEHLLISNQFDVEDDPNIFLNPMFVLSGGVYQLTGSVALGWLVWKPVAIAFLLEDSSRTSGGLADPGDGPAWLRWFWRFGSSRRRPRCSTGQISPVASSPRVPTLRRPPCSRSGTAGRFKQPWR